MSEENEDICPKSEDGIHIPDWNSLSITHDGEAYVDVNCSACGRSGCVGSAKTLLEGISW